MFHNALMLMCQVFGKTVQEAISNLNEALALYFEDKNAISTITPIQETQMGEIRIHV